MAGKLLSHEPLTTERTARKTCVMEPQDLTPHQRIIRRFGGMTALARALGHKNPTTVQRWWEGGHIPGRRLSEVFAAGQKLSPPLRTEEFFPPVVDEAAKAS